LISTAVCPCKMSALFKLPRGLAAPAFGLCARLGAPAVLAFSKALDAVDMAIWWLRFSS
jgi:hypothetical protein